MINDTSKSMTHRRDVIGTSDRPAAESPGYPEWASSTGSGGVLRRLKVVLEKDFGLCNQYVNSVSVKVLLAEA